MNQLNAQAYLSELKLSLFRWINSSWRTRFCGHVSIVQCACRLWMHSSPSPPIHTGCGLILGREGMVVVVTVSGPLSCTSQMFDFIRALSICRVRSEDVAELEDILDVCDFVDFFFILGRSTGAEALDLMSPWSKLRAGAEDDLYVIPWGQFHWCVGSEVAPIWSFFSPSAWRTAIPRTVLRPSLMYFLVHSSNKML